MSQRYRAFLLPDTQKQSATRAYMPAKMACPEMDIFLSLPDMAGNGLAEAAELQNEFFRRITVQYWTILSVAGHKVLGAALTSDVVPRAKSTPSE